MKIFTHGKVRVEQPFFLILVLSVAAEMLWTALFTPISALNRHRVVTYSLAVASVVAFACAYFWAIPAYGLAGAAAVLLSVHILIVLVCVRVSARLTNARRIA
jgi:O-antigen/teichoic acid export membrane protein